MQPVFAILQCALFVAVIVLLSLVGLYIFSRWWYSKNITRSNEFIGIFFGALSLIYSLLIAFVIIAVWEDYEELNQTVEKETDQLSSIISHTATLPDSLKIPVTNAIASYCNMVINEWSQQKDHTDSSASAIPSLRLFLLQSQPQGRLQENVFNVVDENLSNISDLRRERLEHYRSHVPTLVWLILVAGSILVIVFSFFVYTESAQLKRIGVSFLSAMVAMSIFLVYTLDHPFSSSIRISEAPYKKVVLLLEQMK